MQDCIVNQLNSRLDFSLSWRDVKTFPCCFPISNGTAMQLQILYNLVYCTLLWTVGWGEVGIEVKDIMFLYEGILLPHGETAVSSLNPQLENKFYVESKI